MKRRKLVQWVCAYTAGAWLTLEVSDVVGDKFGWPLALYRILIVFLCFGFFLTLVLAWYHGERGRQRASGPELVTIAALVVVCGGVLKTTGSAADEPPGSRAPPEGGPMGTAAVPLRAVLYDNPSVAILPLRNLGTAEDEAFVEGLHDDILSALQKIGGLTVISNTSVRRYRARDVLLPQIARELRVQAVGEGTVSRGGDRVRVNIQLIEGATDAHLWSGQYDRELTAADLFDIRAEIARSVAQAMQATLTSEEERRLNGTPPATLTAYDWVQIARSRCDGCEERAAAYREALGEDSTYAPAWAGLASNYAVRVLNFGASPSLADSALLLADRALALDYDLPSALGAKALAYYAGWGQSERAVEYTLRATRLEPGNASRWGALGAFYAMRGRWVEALDAYWRCLRLRPTSAWVRGNMAELYAALGLTGRAAEVLEEGSMIDPDNETVLHYASYARAVRGDVAGARESAGWTVARHPNARNHQWAALLAVRAGDLDAALAHAGAARALAPEGLSLESNVRSVPVTLASVLIRTGRPDEAEELVSLAREQLRDRLERGADDGYTRVEMAAVAALGGRADEAASWLDSARAAGYRYHREIELDPTFDNVRDHASFARVLAAMRSDVDEMRVHVLAQEAELQRARDASGRGAAAPATGG